MRKSFTYANGIFEVNSAFNSKGYEKVDGLELAFLYQTICSFIVSAGFAMLPFLWAVNAVWFAKPAFCDPHFEEQKQIKRCKKYPLFLFTTIYNLSVFFMNIYITLSISNLCRFEICMLTNFLFDYIFRCDIFWNRSDIMDSSNHNVDNNISNTTSRLGRRSGSHYIPLPSWISLNVHTNYSKS